MKILEKLKALNINKRHDGDQRGSKPAATGDTETDALATHGRRSKGAAPTAQGLSKPIVKVAKRSADVKGPALADLPTDVLAEVYTRLTVSDLKRMTLTQKAPQANEREALLHAWTKVFARSGFVLNVDPSESLVRVLNRFESWQKLAEQPVTDLINQLRPDPNWATNKLREAELCKEISHLVRQRPEPVFSLDFSHYNGAGARNLRRVYGQCTNLTHLTLPFAIKQEDVDVMIRGLQNHDALESLSVQAFFDIDRDALLKKLPKSVAQIDLKRIF